MEDLSPTEKAPPWIHMTSGARPDWAGRYRSSRSAFDWWAYAKSTMVAVVGVGVGRAVPAEHAAPAITARIAMVIARLPTSIAQSVMVQARAPRWLTHHAGPRRRTRQLGPAWRPNHPQPLFW